MLSLQLRAFDHPLAVLCLGAHCDDIEIGCGATLARWAREYPNAHFTWAIFSGDSMRKTESRAACAQLLPRPGTCDMRLFEFRESYFPSQVEQIKDAFEELKTALRPDVILTHRLEDRHQDHKLIAELTWNTFRSHVILEYEIPKYEGDLGHPNVFIPLDTEELGQKIRCLADCFPSQRSRTWFTDDTFRALARLRGIECGAPSGFAEAFYGRKLCL